MSRLVVVGLISVMAVLIVGAGVFFSWRMDDDSAVRTIAVERQDVVQEISFTGRLQAEREAELGFELGGTLTERAVDVGESVVAGQTLARVDASVAQLELAQARAERVSAQEKAQVALEAVQAQYQTTKAEQDRIVEQRRQAVRDAKDELDQKKEVYQQVVREDGDDASTAGTALANIRAAESAYHAAQQTLVVAERSATTVTTKAQTAVDEAAAAYQSTLQAGPAVAGLSAVEAGEALAQVKLAKSVLAAPFDGVVMEIDAEVGEYIAPGTAVVRVATPEVLEVVADVPETDALQLAIGLPAEVTFDAFSAEIWQATVYDISPGARIIEGVPTYEVTLRLQGEAERLKAGLTANVLVHVAERADVLAVPRRAIFQRNGQDYVRVQGADGAIEERAITTGLVGSTGLVEIRSGVQEGEAVVTGALSDS